MFASQGNGSTSHMIGEQFRWRPDRADRRAVSWRSACEPGSSRRPCQHVVRHPACVSNLQSGKVRALAVCAPERVKVLPDVPTIAEAGYPHGGRRLVRAFAPASTPPAAVAWMNSEAKKAFEHPEFASDSPGKTVLPLGPPEVFGAHVTAETERWALTACRHQGGVSARPGSVATAHL